MSRSFATSRPAPQPSETTALDRPVNPASLRGGFGVGSRGAMPVYQEESQQPYAPEDGEEEEDGATFQTAPRGITQGIVDGEDDIDQGIGEEYVGAPTEMMVPTTERLLLHDDALAEHIMSTTSASNLLTRTTMHNVAVSGLTPENNHFVAKFDLDKMRANDPAMRDKKIAVISTHVVACSNQAPVGAGVSMRGPGAVNTHADSEGAHGFMMMPNSDSTMRTLIAVGDAKMNTPGAVAAMFHTTESIMEGVGIMLGGGPSLIQAQVLKSSPMYNMMCANTEELGISSEQLAVGEPNVKCVVVHPEVITLAKAGFKALQDSMRVATGDALNVHVVFSGAQIAAVQSHLSPDSIYLFAVQLEHKLRIYDAAKPATPQ